MYKKLFEKGETIKIIGDSFAAGAGSSKSYKTKEILFKDGEMIFYKRIAPNSWWGLLENYLLAKYPRCTIENKGCGGAYSYQINKYLDDLVEKNDTFIFILLGLNNRKLEDGMEKLRIHFEKILDCLVVQGKSVVILTPTPSTESNEFLPSRLFHTEQVVMILRDIAKRRKIPLIDNYQYVTDYLLKNNLTIDDLIYCEGCTNDGFHPGDQVQKLIFYNIIEFLEI